MSKILGIEKQNNIINSEHLINLYRYYGMNPYETNQLGDNKNLLKFLMESRSNSLYNSLISNWISNINVNGSTNQNFDQLFQTKLNENKNLDIKNSGKFIKIF